MQKLHHIKKQPTTLTSAMCKVSSPVMFAVLHNQYTILLIPNVTAYYLTSKNVLQLECLLKASFVFSCRISKELLITTVKISLKANRAVAICIMRDFTFLHNMDALRKESKMLKTKDEIALFNIILFLDEHIIKKIINTSTWKNYW